MFGKTRSERYVDERGEVRQRVVKLPLAEWQVLLREHHEGYIDWETYLANRARIAANQPGKLRGSGRAVREGAALLQGLARCGHCGRRMRTQYRARYAPVYFCRGAADSGGRGASCLRVGGEGLDRAVAAALLGALRAGGVAAALRAAERMESGREAALEQLRLAVDRREREAAAAALFELIAKSNPRASTKYQLQLEASLEQVERAQAELAEREARRPRELDAAERRAVLALGRDLERVWNAPTTQPRDRKELLRALLEEAVVSADRERALMRVWLRWRGGQVSELELERPRAKAKPLRTAEDTVEFVRRLAAHHPDRVIAGILNRQGKRTARGLRFDRNRVGNLRRQAGIACYRPPAQAPEGAAVSVLQAARELGLAASTVHRWINDGFIPAEQVIPGAPWRVRLTPELRALFVEEAPPGYVPMREALRALGVSRQTVLQWVKRGKLEAVMICRGKRKGLRIKVVDQDPGIFGRSA